LPERRSPGSSALAIAWAIEEIGRWRDEAGIPWRPDGKRLYGTLEDLERAGLPSALSAFVVLGCEWLFRVAKVQDNDVDDVLKNVESGLAGVMRPEYAYWIVETLREPLALKVRKEGRKLVSLGLYVPGQPPAFDLFERGPRKRERPTRLVSPSRGRVPWPAPWVAGAIVRQLLATKGSDPGRQPLNLTRALYGQRSVEPVEFKAQARGLVEPVSEWWAEAFEHRYENWLARTSGDAEDWAAMWRSHLSVFEPKGIFPCDHHRTRALLDSYAAAGRRHGQKRTATDGS
jgi:hypothetical protein